VFVTLGKVDVAFLVRLPCFDCSSTNMLTDWQDPEGAAVWQAHDYSTIFTPSGRSACAYEFRIRPRGK